MYKALRFRSTSNTSLQRMPMPMPMPLHVVFMSFSCNFYVVFMTTGPMRHRNRSEEHTSELQSLMRISYAVFCLKKKKTKITTNNPPMIYYYRTTKSKQIHNHKSHYNRN